MQISDINFQPLLDNLGIKFGTVFQVDTTGKKPHIISPNLVDQCGILGMGLSEVTIDFFNFGEMEEGGYWMNVYFWMKQLGGGTNGAEIMTAHVDEGGWRWMYNAPPQRV